MVIDKLNVIPLFTPDAPKKIELGCGPVKKSPDHIGIDKLDTPATDIVGDAMDVLKIIPDCSVSEVYSSHFAEHVNDLQAVLVEVHRVLVEGGVMITVVPHFSNPYFYSDPTHRRFFGLYSFSYYCRERIFRRKVPSYSQKYGFELISVDLIFKASRPHYLSHAIRRTFGLLFNCSNIFKEIYENSFTSVVTCYEISYTIRKVRAGT